jgi:hypothetical protein
VTFGGKGYPQNGRGLCPVRVEDWRCHVSVIPTLKLTVASARRFRAQAERGPNWELRADLATIPNAFAVWERVVDDGESRGIAANSNRLVYTAVENLG